MTRSRVLILGGGPAGLSAAVILCELGYSVTLAERAGRLGGGLCAPPADGEPSADQIPPLVLGCHHETRRLLAGLPAGHSVEFPAALRFQFVLPGHRLAVLPRLWGPTLVRGAATVAGFTGLPVRDRLHLLNFLERLWEEDLHLPADVDSRRATELWQMAKQSESTIRRIWTPLCRFLVGNEPDAVSAALLASSLRILLLGSRRDSAIGLVRPDFALGLLPSIEARLRESKVKSYINSAATHLVTKGARVTAVRLENGRELTADWYLSALPPDVLSSLLPERWLAQYASFQRLTDWQWLPRISVRLDCRLKQPVPWLTLRAEGPFDWTAGIPQKGKTTASLQAWCISTGRPDLLKWSDDKLYAQAMEDLPLSPTTFTADQVIGHRVFRAPRAVPSLGPGTSRLRPVPQSPIANLFLAGGWTATGLPVNLESAFVSGRRGAEAIHKAARRGVDLLKGAH